MYNRPSYGKSDASVSERDGKHIVNELRELLKAQGLKPPYILVGHSLGGLYMQYFARRYPDEVRALILVDSTHPKQFVGDGSPQNWSAVLRAGFKMTLNDTQEMEFELINQTGEQVLALPPPQVPVTVLSASEPVDKSSKYGLYVYKLRQEMPSLYPNSKQIWVDSGHNIPAQKLDVVIEAILDAIKNECE
jgi:pimeloyl-ACP methyl ester carboxylesterase